MIRHFYDARVERGVLRRELFKDYMRLRSEGISGLVAIQRIGALRLPKKEFDILVEAVSRCGHPPESKKDVNVTTGKVVLYDFLLFAAAKEHEVSPGIDRYNMMCEMKGIHRDTASSA